jgi:hypothetical protein
MTDIGLLAELEQMLIDGGAAMVGCADLTPVPIELRKHFPRGVSIGVALSPEIIAGIIAGPTDAYSQEYDRANTLLDRLGNEGATLLRHHGYAATALSTTVAELDKAMLHRSTIPNNPQQQNLLLLLRRWYSGREKRQQPTSGLIPNGDMSPSPGLAQSAYPETPYS